ncbi:MAG: DUF3604 domain-containing protein, partial [Myxococcota bacterium]|nr:DUF3604 domain-containing protein [Myxococcota bacterium]
RDTAKLDFFSIADHDYYPDNMTSSDWTTIKNAANSYNADGSFVTFWGFEWTSDTPEYQTNGLGLGHITIINSSDFCISSSTRTMSQLGTWLSTRDVVAFFNHPGQYGTTFDKFQSGVTDKIVGMELWNRGDGFSTYYYNDGYYRNDGNLGYFDEAIQRGWYIGASGSDDNHSGSWGTTNGYRLAVLATAKTRAAIYSALKARRFYSTLDKNLVLSFTANGAEMGSKISGGSLNFQIKASDKDNESFSRIRLLKKGVLAKEWTPNSAGPTVSTTLSGVAGDYFYVIVRESDGNEAISSPIFIK